MRTEEVRGQEDGRFSPSTSGVSSSQEVEKNKRATKHKLVRADQRRSAGCRRCQSEAEGRAAPRRAGSHAELVGGRGRAGPLAAGVAVCVVRQLVG